MKSALARRTDAFPARRTRQRAAARRRVAARVVVPMSKASRARDPMARPRGGIGWVALALTASLLAHGSLGLGLLRPPDATRVAGPVRIEVREPPPPPPPRPEPPPEPEPPKVRQIPRKVAIAPPAPEAPPPPKIPPRVVGISLESTTGEGSGPSFAVGATALGKTERVAAAPTAAPPPVAVAEPAPETTNRVSTRVPTTGVVFTPPKKTKEVKASYPDLLRTQGIEADVRLMVSIDASGHVTAVKVIAGAPQPEFNESARKAALEEEYEPATRNGTKIPYTLTFTSRFRLDIQ